MTKPGDTFTRTGTDGSTVKLVRTDDKFGFTWYHGDKPEVPCFTF